MSTDQRRTIGNAMTLLEKRGGLLKMSAEQYDLDNNQKYTGSEKVLDLNQLRNVNDHKFYDGVMRIFGEIANAAGYIDRV